MVSSGGDDDVRTLTDFAGPTSLRVTPEEYRGETARISRNLPVKRYLVNK